MGKHILVVLSNAVDGKDDEFNDWYTNTHLGDILRAKPFVAAQRYKLSSAQLGDGGAELPYKYLAIYEIEGEIDEAAQALSPDKVGEMYISPALDMERTVAWLYSPITDRVAR